MPISVLHRAISKYWAPFFGRGKKSKFILKLFVFSATREIPQPPKAAWQASPGELGRPTSDPRAVDRDL